MEYIWVYLGFTFRVFALYKLTFILGFHFLSFSSPPCFFLPPLVAMASQAPLTFDDRLAWYQAGEHWDPQIPYPLLDSLLSFSVDLLANMRANPAYSGWVDFYNESLILIAVSLVILLSCTCRVMTWSIC